MMSRFVADFPGEQLEPTYWLAKAIIKPAVASWFRCSFEGLENIPRSGGAIVAFNHIAYLDPFIAAYAVDKVGRRPRFLAKAELFDDPRIAWIIKGAKQIPVHRGTRSAPMALDAAVKALEGGEVVVIFPEGTITTDPDLNPMAGRTGVARLAEKTGAPLIPAALWGTHNVWPKGYAKNWWPPKQPVLVKVGAPMKSSGGASAEELRSTTAKVIEEIGSLVADLRPAVPDRRKTRRTAA